MIDILRPVHKQTLNEKRKTSSKSKFKLSLMKSHAADDYIKHTKPIIHELNLKLASRIILRY